MNDQNATKLTVTPRYLKTGQAARYLGLSRRYLSELAAEGCIRHSRIGRRTRLFAVKDLDAFVERWQVGGDN